MKKLNYVVTIIGFSLTVALIQVAGQAMPSPASETLKTTTAPLDALLFTSENGKQQSLRFAEISKLKRLTVKASDHGKEAVFEGVALVDVLKLGGVEFGEALRGKRMATFLLVEAADNYQAVFALPEIDPGFTDKIIILGDKRDGRGLSKDEGPWRIVVPDEKCPARWVRQVVGLKILRATN